MQIRKQYLKLRGLDCDRCLSMLLFYINASGILDVLLSHKTGKLTAKRHSLEERLNFQSTRDSSESTIEDELFPDLNDADYKSNLAHHNGSVHTVDVSEVKKITVVDKIDS